MDFSPAYLLGRFAYRFLDFFHHWYVDGSRAFGHAFISVLAAADRTFAVKITLQHFFEPLYKDYSPVGRVVGIVFRAGRAIIGTVVYCCIAAAFAAAYAAWLAVPAVILYYAVRNR
ncbi:MAG TPA: hypothetical protein VMT99_02465 [Candidatus Paceibacterota bacterium]|nr:hypothetical protein [Candidatus Paceibacterota bacterium]